MSAVLPDYILHLVFYKGLPNAVYIYLNWSVTSVAIALSTLMEMQQNL